MKITVESTDEFMTVKGIKCRVWEGTTDEGIPTVALIARLGPTTAHDVPAFERECLEAGLLPPEHPMNQDQPIGL